MPLEVPEFTLPERTVVKAYNNELVLINPKKASDLVKAFNEQNKTFAYWCANEDYYITFGKWLNSVVTRTKDDDEIIRELLNVLLELKLQSEAIRAANDS